MSLYQLQSTTSEISFPQITVEEANKASEGRTRIELLNPVAPEISLKELLLSIFNSSQMVLRDKTQTINEFANFHEQTFTIPDIVELLLAEAVSVGDIFDKICSIFKDNLETITINQIVLDNEIDKSKFNHEILVKLINNKHLRKSISAVVEMCQKGLIGKDKLLKLLLSQTLECVKEDKASVVSIPMSDDWFYPIILKEGNEKLKKVEINSGPCLFGVPNAVAVVKNKDGSESIVSLVHPKIEIEGEIIDLIFNLHPHVSEIENYERLAKSIKQVVQDPNNPISNYQININIPEVEYYFYDIFKAYQEDRCSKELFLKYIENVEIRSRKDIDDYRQVLSEVLGIEENDPGIQVSQGYDFLKSTISKAEKFDIKEILSRMKAEPGDTGEFLLNAILEVKESKGHLKFSDIPAISYVYALLRNCLNGSFSLGVEGIAEKRICETAIEIVKHKSFPEELRQKIMEAGLGGLYVTSRVAVIRDYGATINELYGFQPTETFKNQVLDSSDITYLENNGISHKLNSDNGSYNVDAPFSHLPEVIDEARQRLKKLYRSEK